MATLEFFFDCSSPWTYLAFTRIQDVIARTKATVAWKPVLVGGIFNAVNKDVYDRRANPDQRKASYSEKDLQDWARLAGITIGKPQPFPVNAVLEMRCCLAADERGKLIEFARGCFDAYWRDLKDVSQPAVIAEICSCVGLNPDEILARASAQDIKDKLRANTDDVIARGGFGSPTMFVNTTDMYFGNDRLPLVEAALMRAAVDSTDNSNYWAGSEPPEALGPQPFLRLPWVVGLLWFLLIATHFARTLLPEATSNLIFAEYGFIPARYSAAFLSAHHLDGGSYFARALPFITYSFLHANWTHVALNTLWLLAFGPPVARRFGAFRFLLLFFICGAAGAAVQLVCNWGSIDPVIGASAGVAGLMAICFRIVGQGPLSAQPRGNLAPLFSRQVLTWTAVWVVLNIVAGLTGLGSGPGAPQVIAWQAHLGGYFAGLILCGLFDPFGG